MLKKLTICLTSMLFLSACNTSSVDSDSERVQTNAALNSALAVQSEKVQQRYQYRHPKQTLEFFGIKPGMKVIEVLPGRGWYTKILLPFLGSEGEVVGVDYPQALWPHFSFMTPERLEKKKTWVATWTDQANTWRDETSASVSAFQYAEMPDSMKGSVDAALFIRALHNLNRHRDKGDYLGQALKDTYAALKPGGLLGVVQHKALEDRSDDWADGNKGYLKQSFVISTMAEYGFEFIAQSDINANPKDLADKGDSVWRLPPSSRSKSKDQAYLKSLKEIGESNRMTLLFKKT